MSRFRQPDGRIHGVVAAIARDDGRWLCIRRSPSVAAPLKICFPGGAIESGESQETAVIREMHEELGILVRPLHCIWRWESPTTELTLWGWLANWTTGALRPNAAEVAEVHWLTSDEAINHPDAMPTNRDFVAALMSNTAPASA